MTIASDLVQQAFREGNLLPVGQSPTTAQAAEGLSRLNNLIKSLFGHTLGVQLQEWLIAPPLRTAAAASRWPQAPRADDMPSDVWPYPTANSRLISRITSATTVYFPEIVHDGAVMALVDVGATATLTLDGNGRTIESAATLAVTSGGTMKKWFYRGDTGDWGLLATLLDTDESPLPEEFDDLLICGLAVRLSPRFGVEPLEATKAVYVDMLRKMKQRYQQPMITRPDSADYAAGLGVFTEGNLF